MLRNAKKSSSMVHDDRIHRNNVPPLHGAEAMLPPPCASAGRLSRLLLESVRWSVNRCLRRFIFVRCFVQLHRDLFLRQRSTVYCRSLIFPNHVILGGFMQSCNRTFPRAIPNRSNANPRCYHGEFTLCWCHFGPPYIFSPSLLTRECLRWQLFF